MVVHALRHPSPDAAARASLVGFVVAKSVGGAVARNRVKRRLRHLVAARLDSLPATTDLVIRALPAAAAQPARLSDDFDRAWARLGGQAGG